MRAPAPRLVLRVTSRLSPRLAPTSRRFTAAPRRLRAAGAACLAACLVLATSLAEAAPPPVERLKLPPGFHAEVFAADVANAREMAWSPRGILYVGSTEGSVHALTVRDGRVVARHVVASGLEMPVGVAWRDGALYISAVSRILRLDGIDERLDQPPKPVVVTDALPSERQHGWKFIAFGPDGKLYVPKGAPCNVCRRTGSRPLRDDRAHERRRQRLPALRARRAQYGRLRLAPRHARTLVHRQRPRHARRRRPRRRTEPRCRAPASTSAFPIATAAT